VQGLCARGAFTVDFKWQQGRVVKAAITAKVGAGPVPARNVGAGPVPARTVKVRLLYNGKQTTFTMKAGETRNI
jgi:hypothetical protein